MSLADPIVAQPSRKRPRTHAVVFTEDKKSSKMFLEACLRQTAGDVSLEVIGTGKHTMDLVDEAKSRLPRLEKKLAERLARVERFSKGGKTSQTRGKKRVGFDEVWIVFDRDDHPDFDLAVKEVRKRGFLEGWSNECFELWYYLYSCPIDAATLKCGIGRAGVFSHLTSRYNLETEYGRKYEKLKGDAGFGFHNKMARDILSMQKAYGRAVDLFRNSCLTSKTPSARNPYTHIHNLIAKLLPQIAHGTTGRRDKCQR